MPRTHQSPCQYTTRLAASVTVPGEKPVVLDPLVSKCEYFNQGRGSCRYDIKHVSAQAIHAMRCMPEVLSRVEEVLSNESGNQLPHIFNSNDDARKRFVLAGAHYSNGLKARDIGLLGVRTDGSSCLAKTAVAFHALVDIYSRMEPPPCKEVRMVWSAEHAWAEVLTHDDERVVIETWTLFPEALAAEDGFGYDLKKARVVESWRPGMDKSEAWADFKKAAVALGPIEQAPPSNWNWLNSNHLDQGLQGYARSSVAGLNASPWNRAEACRTNSEREELGLPSHQRVLYKGPDESTYNGDLVRKSRVDWHRRTDRAMRRIGFPERFEAREILRNHLMHAAHGGDAAAVVSLLKKHHTLIATGPDCSGVLDDALWAAVQSRRATHVEIADALIEAGANEQATRDGGQTLLMEAAALGDLTMVEALCVQGLRSDQRNDVGNNAFHFACNRGHVAVAEYLRMKTPRLLHEPDALGRTPLMLALLGGQPHIVDALLSAGAGACN